MGQPRQPESDSRMSDEGRQQVGSTLQPLQLLDQHTPQLSRILGGEVGEPTVLGVPPHPFVGVRLGGLAGERLRHDLRMVCQVGPHGPGAVVDVAPVPQDRHRAGDVPLQLLEGRHRVRAAGVRVVGPQVEVQPEPPALGADRPGAEGRDPVVPVPTPHDRCLAPWGQGAAHGRGEQESRLVEEDQVGLAPPGAPDDPGQLHLPSGGDRRLVPLPGPLLRLLAGPPEPPLEDLADVLGVEADAEVPLDQRGHSVSGPQLGAPAVGLGSLEQQLLQLLELPIVQSGGAAGVGPGGQGFGAFPVEFQPGGDGGSTAAEEVGDIVRGFPPLDQFDGSATAAFEFLGSTDGSHTLGTLETAFLFS
jgi:hypothetical protein